MSYNYCNNNSVSHNHSFLSYNGTLYLTCCFSLLQHNYNVTLYFTILHLAIATIYCNVTLYIAIASQYCH